MKMDLLTKNRQNSMSIICILTDRPPISYFLSNCSLYQPTPGLSTRIGRFISSILYRKYISSTVESFFIIFFALCILFYLFHLVFCAFFFFLLWIHCMKIVLYELNYRLVSNSVCMENNIEKEEEKNRWNKRYTICKSSHK